MKKFFVGCNLDFEAELSREIEEFWPFLIEVDGTFNSTALNMETQIGGIELTAPMAIGLQINFFSKLANRVLLRIATKRIRDFPAFFQWLEKMKKDPLLASFPASTAWNFEVSASSSRLNNEKRIQEILKEHFKPASSLELAQQTLYVRIFNDEVTLSIDSTGELLHKRNQKDVGIAPLRETLASFCIRQMMRGYSLTQLQKIRLLDVMCGSGTFLLEAGNILAPQFREELSFLSWTTCPKILKSKTFFQNYPSFPSLFCELMGSDINPEVIELARSAADKNREIQWRVEDLFADGQPLPREQKGGDAPAGPDLWVVSNIPYGERIREVHSIAEILLQINKKFAPARVGLLMSERQFAQVRESQLPQPINSHHFKNGGLRVVFVIWGLKKGQG